MPRFASVAASAALALSSFSGCSSLAPQADRPAGELPGLYAAGALPEMDLEDSLRKLFSDKELQATVDRAVARNPDLQVARTRLEEAGFNLRKTQGTLLPTLDGFGFARRDQVSGGSRVANLAIGLDAAWEVDVWGRLRAGVDAAAGDEASLAADYAAARQSLISQTMQAWFDLVGAELSLRLSLREVESLESTQKIIDRRYEAGQTTLADTDISRTDLENSRADLAASRDLRDQAARQLRVLTGDYPDAGISASSWPSLKRGIRAGVPSDLLRQRPDVAAAYFDILAADSRVKIAHADLFPSFFLTASNSQESNRLADLVRSGFNVWSLAADVTTPIFEGGQLRAELGASGKRAEQAFHTYQSVVLDAFKEVEDALGSERYLAAEEKARLAALDAAKGAYSRSKRDYEAGITDLFSLLDSQRNVFATEQQTIDLRNARLNNRVALALALGKAE